jgi:hypothetical protein
VKSLLTFDETNFEFRGAQDSVRLWLTPNGDSLRLFHFPVPPDIEADLHDMGSVRAFYRRVASQAGLGVLEIDTGVVNGCSVVRTLFKVAQGRMGRIYIGALTFPFRDFSYVFRVESPELGMTGSRETAVFAKLISKGEASIDTGSNPLTGWLDDPYDSNEVGPMTRNISERPEYDTLFPNHPLSRARWILDHLQYTLSIDDSVKRQPNFHFSPSQSSRGFPNA